MNGKTKTGYEIRPIPPSNSIKIANKLLFDTYLRNAFDNTLEKIRFSDYIIEVK